MLPRRRSTNHKIMACLLYVVTRVHECPSLEGGSVAWPALSLLVREMISPLFHRNLILALRSKRSNTNMAKILLKTPLAPL